MKNIYKVIILIWLTGLVGYPVVTVIASIANGESTSPVIEMIAEEKMNEIEGNESEDSLKKNEFEEESILEGKVQDKEPNNKDLIKDTLESSVNVEEVSENKVFNEVSIYVKGRGNPVTAKKREQRQFSHSSLESTGLFLPRGEEILIYVEEEAEELYAVIGMYGSYDLEHFDVENEELDMEYFRLVQGENRVVKPSGAGIVYLENRSEVDGINTQLSGGLNMPKYTLGKTTKESFKEQVAIFGSEVPFFELEGDYTIAAFQTEHLENLHYEEEGRVERLISNWDRIVVETNNIYGFMNEAGGVAEKNNNQRIYIANPTEGAGYMYATDYYISIQNITGAGKEVIQANPEDDQWGLWHEIGHTYQNPHYIFDYHSIIEVTVNISANEIYGQLGYGDRTEAAKKRIEAHLSSPLESRDYFSFTDDPFLMLGMFVTLRRVFGDTFYPRMNQLYRSMEEANFKFENTGEFSVRDSKVQLFIKTASEIVQRDLVSYFVEWGLPVEEATRNYCKQFLPLEKEIWRDISGYSGRYELNDILGYYTVPKVTKLDRFVPIFTPVNEIEIDLAGSVPYESKVEVSNVQYNGIGRETSGVRVVNSEGIPNIILFREVGGGQAVHLFGNASGSQIIAPNPLEQKFQVLGVSGRFHQSWPSTSLYASIKHYSSKGELKNEVLINGQDDSDIIGKQLNNQSYEVGDVIDFYHAESHTRIDRYLENELLERDNARYYRYQMTSEGWQAIFNNNKFEFHFEGDAENPTATVTKYNGSQNAVDIPSTAINFSAGWIKETNVTNIGERSFRNGSMKSVAIPTSVKKIEKEAFRYAGSLTSVHLSEGLEVIGSGAFDNTNVSEINFPKSLKKIDDGAFWAANLAKIDLSEAIEEIGANAFRSNGTIEEVIIRSDTSIYGSGIFSGSLVESIVVPRDKLATIKGQLTSTVMSSMIVNPTRLRTLEDYTEDKRLIQKNEKESLILEVTDEYYFDMKNPERWSLDTPNQELKWFKDGELISSGLGNSKYSFENLSESDSGDYYAERNGQKLETIQVTVLREVEGNSEELKVNPVSSIDRLITGTGEKSSTIKITVNGKIIGVGEVNSEGSFSITIPPQEAGTVISVTQLNLSGGSTYSEVTVSKVEETHQTTNTFKLGYWQSFGLVLEGQFLNESWDLSSNSSLQGILQLVNEDGVVEASSSISLTNWYDSSQYNGYQGIVDRTMIESLSSVSGKYELRVSLQKNGKELGNEAIEFPGFVGRSGLLQNFTSDFLELPSSHIGTSLITTERMNQTAYLKIEKEDGIIMGLISEAINEEGRAVNGYILNTDFDFSQEHQKNLIIETKSGEEVMVSENVHTWDLSNWGLGITNLDMHSGFQVIIPTEYMNTALYQYKMTITELENKETEHVSLVLDKIR